MIGVGCLFPTSCLCIFVPPEAALYLLAHTLFSSCTILDYRAHYSLGNGHTTFAHVISGYDAGYYGYLFSQVYSADMFHTIFAKDPMNPAEGQRYRRTVLEKGGSIDALDLLKEFLGREPSNEAFYRELGLQAYRQP